MVCHRCQKEEEEEDGKYQVEAVVVVAVADKLVRDKAVAVVVVAAVADKLVRDKVVAVVGMNRMAFGKTLKEGLEGQRVRCSLCCTEQEEFCRRSLLLLYVVCMYVCIFYKI